VLSRAIIPLPKGLNIPTPLTTTSWLNVAIACHFLSSRWLSEVGFIKLYLTVFFFVIFGWLRHTKLAIGKDDY
jgi:hypothetical protein